MTSEELVFPSEEWLQRYVEELNKSKNYEEAAKNWEGDFIFEVEPDGSVIKEPVRLYLDLWHGKCRAARIAGPDDTAEFLYSGKYENWKRLLAGEIHPIKGIMQRKFKLKGSYAKVMRATKAALELVATAQKVPTKFLDE